jgi:hypothetical protein
VSRHRLLLITLIGALVLVTTPAVAARWVSYQALLSQVKSGPVIRAIINRERVDVEIKFRDLSEWEASYPAVAQGTLQRLLRARHIRVLFASRHAAIRSKATTVHHHLRYIAAGMFVALAVIGSGAFLYSRRRRATTGFDPPHTVP